jgi:RNA polymerase sigma-70 factor, ECF subfamily
MVRSDHCKDLNDNELIRLSFENLDYFSCLYNRYETELIKYTRRISGIDHEESQDILQEAFIKIWRNLNEFDTSLKVSSWIYRIVHNETISYMRKKKSYGKDKTHDVELFRNILSEEIESQTHTEEQISIMLDALDHLPIKYKEVLILKFLEQKSYTDISDILKIPEGTVAIRINRAKSAIRGHFSK